MLSQLKILIRRYFYVFDEPFHRWALLLAAFIFSSMLDVFGIGSMGLFIQAVMAPEALSKVPFIPEWFLPDDPDNLDRTIILAGVLSFVLFGARTLFAYILHIFTIYFNGHKQIKIQEKLFHSYMHASLIFRKRCNYSKMLYNVNFLTRQFITAFSNNLLSFASNLVLFVVLATFLMIANLMASLAVCGLFGIIIALYYLVIRSRSTFYGQLLADATKQQYKNVQEGIGALDEVQILGCQPFFEKKVSGNLRMSFRYGLRSAFLTMIPRPFAEFALLSFIILFTLVYQQFYGSLTEISALLGMFALAGLRMVPAASLISANMHGMKNTSYAVHQLYDELKALDDEDAGMAMGDDTPEPAFERSIELKEVTYSYPDGNTPAVQGVNISIPKGARIALVGRSGSGKTTLMNILLGNIRPDQGGVFVDSAPVLEHLASWRGKIFYLPQTIYLLDDTIRRNVALGVEDCDIDDDRMNKVLALAQLTPLVESLPDGVYTHVGEHGTRLSGGQRQRVGIARALYHQREILIMDEATSALDDETEYEVKESIRNLPPYVTVIMITHNLKEEDIFDQVIRLGSPAESSATT
jgi:ABC-type multidrug transport system fused ATPase/permease subunit